MPKIQTQTPTLPPIAKQGPTPAAAAAVPAPKATPPHHHGIGDFFRKVEDVVVGGLASTVGLTELAGLRYPVSSYSALVSPTLTRGSRLEGNDAYDKLKAQGFKSVVDLTAEGTDDEKFAKKAGLNTLNVKIIDNATPSVSQMKQFLDFATDPANTPAYVHCEAGKGRTGIAVACYRMAVQGFTADEAIADGKKHGLGLPNQIDFIKHFAEEMKEGAVPGYPKPMIP